MRYCKLCKKQLHQRAVIDGKIKNLQRRKFCLDCSPFGGHNTKDLSQCGSPKTCRMCAKVITRKSEKGKLCWTCANRINRQEKIQKLQNIVGVACWFCGYDRCWAAMDFHHVYPANRLHGLSTREMQFAWGRIVSEAKKCVLACARCHREIHQGLISQSHVETVWTEKWKDSNSAA